MTLEVDTTDVGKTRVCVATGELDALSASIFRDAFPRCVGRPKLLIDLTGVRFIDSAGLTVLVGLVRRVRELMGEVAVCARGGLRRVLLDSGLDGVVKLSESAESALADLQAGDGATPRSLRVRGPRGPCPRPEGAPPTEA
ncbi:MAG TPA: STAS domain-containing protein [Acidimicrobiales bacterium]|nr:STAS domain-containing protein [Acidimicrobiales bacterium]